MFFPVSSWFAAFTLTLAVEVPIVAAFARPARPELLRLVFLVVVVNLATHLTVWYVLTQLLLVGTREYVLVAEAWAIGVEAAFYAAAVPALPPRRALALAVVANGASALLGRLVTGVLPEFA